MCSDGSVGLDTRGKKLEILFNPLSTLTSQNGRNDRRSPIHQQSEALRASLKLIRWKLASRGDSDQVDRDL